MEFSSHVHKCTVAISEVKADIRGQHHWAALVWIPEATSVYEHFMWCDGGEGTGFQNRSWRPPLHSRNLEWMCGFLGKNSSGHCMAI